MARKTKPGQEPVVSQTQFGNLLREPAPRYVFWDIETGALPDKELMHDFDEDKVKLPPNPGVFSSSNVRTGNMKKAELIAKKIEDCRRDHAAKVAGYQQKCIEARQEAIEKFRKEAPLRGVRNQVLAIGYGILLPNGEIKTFLDLDNERNLTKRFAYMVDRVKDTHGNFYTWNGDGFDIPIMTQKAWRYNVPCRYMLTKYAKMEDISVDGMSYFQCGRNPLHRASLDSVAHFFGLPGKLEGMDGSKFADVLKDDPDKARAYLWHDVDTTYQVCRKMGLLDTPLTNLKNLEMEN